MEREITLPIIQAFGIVEEFVHARDGDIQSRESPTYLKAKMGSLFSISRKNVKKTLKFNLTQTGEDKTSLSLDLSFLEDNILQLVQLVFILLITAVFFMVPIFGVIFFVIITIPSLIFFVWGFTGRGKVEKEFWNYLGYKVSDAKESLHAKNLASSNKTKDDIEKELEEIKNDLIRGNITELEYKKLKRHLEADLQDLMDEQNGRSKSPVR